MLIQMDRVGRVRIRLLASASAAIVVAFGLPTAAIAQNAAAQAPAAESRGANADETPTGDIVVTAQKREERLQDVPISVSVLGGQALDQSTARGVSEELMAVPGVSIAKSSYSGGGLISIRGVSAARTLFAGANPVGYYLDSVPFGFVQSSITPDVDAYDLSRVEALRGPQGTLYGASALAGVVRVLTNDPDLDNFGLKFRTGVSSTDNGGTNYRGDLAVNVPIVDGKLALRAVVGYQDLSGWVDTPTEKNVNSSVTRNYRFKVGAQPTEDLSIVATAAFNRDSAKGTSAGRTYNFRDITLDEPHDSKYDMYGLKVGYDFQSFTATSSTSYLKYSEFGVADAAGRLGGLHAPIAYGNDSRVFSEELVFASSGTGPWKWSGGLYYRDAKDIGRVISAPINVYLDWSNSSKSYAFFGEVTRQFADGKLELTLGGRYFHDKVTTIELKERPPVNAAAGYFRDQDSYNSTTPRAVLTWHPTSDLNVYASYSQGFRSGSPQAYYTVSGRLGFPGVKPDKLRNYEIGLKGDVSIFTFDAAVYHMKWDDVQQVVTVRINGNDIAAIINGDSASGNGFDFSLRARPVRGLDLGGAISWNDMATDANIFDAGVLLFRKGERLNNSPKYNYNLFLNYGAELGGGYEGKLSLSGNYTSEKCNRTIVRGAAAIYCGEPVWTTRAAFSLESPDNWRLTAYVDNLNNFKKAVFGDPVYGQDYQTRLRPRTIGLQFDYHL